MERILQQPTIESLTCCTCHSTHTISPPNAITALGGRHGNFIIVDAHGIPHHHPYGWMCNTCDSTYRELVITPHGATIPK